MWQKLPWPLSLLSPGAFFTAPPKPGWDVKLPEISCDNKQLLSSESVAYSWTTLVLFLSLTCLQAKPGRHRLIPPASPDTSHPSQPPPPLPPLLLWCAGTQGDSVAKLLFLQLWELDLLIVGGQVSNCPHDRSWTWRHRASARPMPCASLYSNISERRRRFGEANTDTASDVSCGLLMARLEES